MEKVKTAVIGFGHLGKWHTQKAHSLDKCELVAIVESYGPNQEEAKKLYPDVKIVGDIKEVINEIDAAIIVTPTSTHFELAKYLVENDKHVFCEKPVCAFESETLELEKKLKSNKIFQVGHSERCHEAWELIGNNLREAPAPRLLKINRFAPFKGRATDVDVVQDLMIHDIDLMLYLLGEKPVSVSAIGHKIRTPKWDSVTANFKFSNGSIAIITSGRNHTHEVRELEVTSSEGVYHINLFTNEYSYATSSKFEDESFVQTKNYEKRDHLLIEQEKFYNSITNNEKVFVSFEDGKRAVELVEKVLLSLESGQEVNLG